jgi:hypothetical protein
MGSDLKVSEKSPMKKNNINPQFNGETRSSPPPPSISSGLRPFRSKICTWLFLISSFQLIIQQVICDSI